MDFDNLTQAVNNIRNFQNYYHTMRIWNLESNELLYESQDNDATEEFAASVLTFQGSTIFIHKDTNTLEVKLPVTIYGQPCSIELIQHRVKKSDADSIQTMQELIMTDSLTGLYNRRFIDEQFPIDMESAFHKNEPLSLIYADIDLFKEINDHYGHVVGDYVIKETANIFIQSIRRKDGWVARYGGDEFLLCLPSINQETAVHIVDRIRSTIEKNDFSMKGNSLKISCSFGVQTLHNADGRRTLNQVIELLDRKLYIAKAKGRNRVIV
ncbi:MAG: diguanylate cyclase protein [Lachnospiraceae bacterium]|jgi:diguanylate cyclase (GGDEF)-like protein|nr:diguanylate cyclase protein [Lachnospiraceae bacterium]